MNDVAHPTFVTVKRPITMLPYDFKQAIADLSAARLVDVQIVHGDHAVVERRAVSEVPLEMPRMPEVTGAVVTNQAEISREGFIPACDEPAFESNNEEKTMSVAAQVRELVEKGATTKREIVEQLGEDKAGNIDTTLSVLKRDGVIVATGRGTFEKAGRGRALETRSHKAKPRPKVADLAPASSASASGARFTLRYLEAHVDCADANAVAELLNALKAVTS